MMNMSIGLNVFFIMSLSCLGVCLIESRDRPLRSDDVVANFLFGWLMFPFMAVKHFVNTTKRS
jgi:hypothetical protein